MLVYRVHLTLQDNQMANLFEQQIAQGVQVAILPDYIGTRLVLLRQMGEHTGQALRSPRRSPSHPSKMGLKIPSRSSYILILPPGPNHQPAKMKRKVVANGRFQRIEVPRQNPCKAILDVCGYNIVLPKTHQQLPHHPPIHIVGVDKLYVLPRF